MQNLTGYIKDLLLMHDCVIIPQFGGFVSSYKPAYFDPALKRFFPPSKEIAFNSKLTHNDGLLCQQIMKNEHKSFAESVDIIYAAVQHTEAMLDNEAVQLSGMGKLERRDDGLLLFEPEKENRLLKASYGLASFSFKELSQEERGSHLKIVKSEKSVAGRSISHFAAAVAALFIIFFFFFPANVKDPNLETADFTAMFDSLNKSALEIGSEKTLTEDEIIPGESENISDVTTDALVQNETSLAEDTEQSQVQNTNQNNTAVPVKEKVKMVSAVTYHIIIASLTSKEQALEFVKQNCTKYFPDYSIIESNGRYRVSIGTFTSKEDAIPVLETFREKNPKFKDAWLLTIKATV